MTIIKKQLQALTLMGLSGLSINALAADTASEHAHSTLHSAMLPSSMSDEHVHEHGSEIYQSSRLDSRWLIDKHGTGHLKSELKSFIGSDENKLFIKAELEKAEGDSSSYSIAPMYSRNVSDFWDLQMGVRYKSDVVEKNQLDQLDQSSLRSYKERNHRVDAVVGMYGLAPYFIETEGYLYVGQDQHVSLSLETEREFLLTQKTILQPYMKLHVLLHEQSDEAKKKGVSEVQAGLKTYYKINPKVMPFIDVAYQYENGTKGSIYQDAEPSEKGWLYGAGISFNF